MITKDAKRVALLGLSGGGLDAQIVRGLNLARRSLGQWRVYDAGHQGAYVERALGRLAEFDGVIGHVVSDEMAERLRAAGVKVVDLAGFRIDRGFAVVTADSEAVGRFAADHLRALNYQSFVFASNSALPFEWKRWAGYHDRLRELVPGAKVRWFIFELAVRADDEMGYAGGLSDLAEFVASADVPTAIFCGSDRAAFETCELCLTQGVPVPERAAVLGVDNNAYLCETASPQLSSIMLPGERIGHEAAVLLDRLMRGEAAAPEPLRLPPVGVFTRQSTEISAVSDRPIAEALSILRAEATELKEVTSIAERVHMDRRTFFRRFKQAVGRTPLQELYRQRIELARQRLVSSNATIFTIAIESGFPDADGFTRRFREATGMTPSAYRRRYVT